MTRLFDDRALAQVVERTLRDAPIPDEKRGAFVTVANATGIKAAIAIKVDDCWQVHAYAERLWGKDEPITYGVAIQGTF